MRNLLYWTWGFFAADALLVCAMILAAIFDKGDAAGRGLGQVYAVCGGIVLVALAIIVALNSYFRTKIGLSVTLALEVAPWAFLVYEAGRRIVARMG